MATAKRPYQKDGRQHSRKSRILWCSECRLAFAAVFLSGLSPQYPSWGFTIRKFYNGHCSDDSSAMSIDVALSTHYGARRNTAIILRASRLAPRQELSATSMDMALLPAAIFLFYGFCHFASSGADLLFAAFCCIFAVQMKIRASVGPFFRVLKALPRFGRLFFLSPKP